LGSLKESLSNLEPLQEIGFDFSESRIIKKRSSYLVNRCQQITDEGVQNLCKFLHNSPSLQRIQLGFRSCEKITDTVFPLKFGWWEKICWWFFSANI